MNILPRNLLFFSIVLLSGCAVLDTLPGMNREANLDDWIAERQYGRALAALSHVDPKDPNYTALAEKRREIESLAQTYEQEVVKQAREDVKAGAWARALDAYDAALQRMPDSTVLKDGLAGLHREQSIRLAEQRLDLAVARARFLERALPIYERIARIAPRDHEAQQQLAAHRKAIDETAQHLAKTGVAAFKAAEYEVAERTLPLAAKLSDDEMAQSAYAELQAWHQARERERLAARKRRLERAKAKEEASRRRFDELMSEYQTAFDASRLVNARTILGQAEATAPSDSEIAQERERLERAISAQVERLYEQGVTHYSRGEFEQAVQVWKQVLELKPKHPSVIESLERAERVLHRLKQLREKQVLQNSAETPLGS